MATLQPPDLEKQSSPTSASSSTFDFASRTPPAAGLLEVPNPEHDRKQRPREDSVPSTIAASMLSFDDEPNWPKGVRPWLCLFGCFMLMWNSWGIVNAYGTYQSYYSQHLLADTPIMLLNLIGSTQSFVVLALSFVVGRLLDANHARQLVGTGAVLVTLGMFLLSVVNGDGHRNGGSYGLTWLTQGFVVGAGQACFFVSSSQIASTWFVKRKAVAIGIVASGASIAGLVYPIMVKFLITEVGFNNAVRYNATLVAVTAAMSFFLAVPNPRHNFRKPEKWLVTKVWIDTGAFRNPAWNWFTASICFVFFGFYAVFFNLEDWAAHNGFAQKDVPPGFQISLGDHEVPNDAIRTFWLLCILNVSSTAGRLFSAFFAERFGALNIHLIATGIGSVLLFLLWVFATTLAPALAFVIIFGAVSGTIIGLPPASIAHILGRADFAQQAKLGQWTGMMYTVAAPFALTGPVIAGFMVSEYGPNNYLTVQLWSGASLFGAFVCMCISRYYSGPSRTLDAIRSFSKSISRSTTLDVGAARGLTGLGTKMRSDEKRSRQGSGSSDLDAYASSPDGASTVAQTPVTGTRKNSEAVLMPPPAIHVDASRT